MQSIEKKLQKEKFRLVFPSRTASWFELYISNSALYISIEPKWPSKNFEYIELEFPDILDVGTENIKAGFRKNFLFLHTKKKKVDAYINAGIRSNRFSQGNKKDIKKICSRLSRILLPISTIPPEEVEKFIAELRSVIPRYKLFEHLAKSRMPNEPKEHHIELLKIIRDGNEEENNSYRIHKMIAGNKDENSRKIGRFKGTQPQIHRWMKELHYWELIELKAAAGGRKKEFAKITQAGLDQIKEWDNQHRNQAI
jgi:hypothetical protein